MSSLKPNSSDLTAKSPDVGYWRSLAQLQGMEDPNVGAEFSPEQTDPMDGPSRRRFVQIMGASVALAGAAGCSKQHRHVVPAVRAVPGRTIGGVQPFATVMEIAGVGYGLLAQSYEGRPIRLDGNPNHPTNKGAISAWSAASILGLYDPDRSKAVYHKASDVAASAKKEWKDFAEEARKIYSGMVSKQGEGVRILSEASSSPTLSAMKAGLLKNLPKAKWIEYEPIGRDNERLGTKITFGQALRAHYDLSKAEVIVDLDADLLGAHPASLQYTREFSANRNPEAARSGAMYNRLYSVESNLSVTGGSADHRLALQLAELPGFIRALDQLVEAELSGKQLANPVRGFNNPRAPFFAEQLAEELVKAKGKSVVAVGYRQTPETAAIVHKINHALGNTGSTVHYLPAPEGDGPAGVKALTDLVDEMKGDKVQTLIILGSNPVYTAPGDLKFGEALAKVQTSIHLGLYRDETGEACSWHIPQAHFLEAWGDARAWDGTISIAQPLIQPLYQGKSAVEFLAQLTGQKADGFALVRNTFTTMFAQGGDALWKKSVQDGVVADSAWKPVAVKRAAPAATGLHEKPVEVTLTGPTWVGVGGPGLEAVFLPDSKVFDGRFTNNAWLQELPDFITKIVWDNAILMSKATADLRGIKHGQKVQATVGDKTITAAVYIQPGQANDSAAFILGYGRRAAGVVGGSAVGRVQTVGFDFYPLRSSRWMDVVTGLRLTPINEYHEFATTQEHSQIDTTGVRERDKRADILIRSDSLKNFKAHPDAIQHKVHELPQVKLFDNPLDHQVKAENKWGMAIDLAKCTGCNACVIACQSENNIPVVGKEQVIKRREMHWLRIDRYFRGNEDELEGVQVVHQPMMCVHCENAPCEQVCPVAATVHSSEGTNDMVYNRCIGTRYCANNCPYKVRRFNFLAWHKQLDDEKNNVLRLVFNPDVTVRSRGVMEKCTFCIQRIRQAKVKAKNAGRPVMDGEIVTACQQACPAGAITFGDLNDKASKLSQLYESTNQKRRYAMLADLNTRPRTEFLAHISNPNPAFDTNKPKEGVRGHA